MGTTLFIHEEHTMTKIVDPAPEANENDTLSDFLRTMIAEDVANGRFNGKVHTRFPPEPNGYLHIGHANAIHTDFKIAEEFGGKCNLRFDDTNPTKEETEYVEGIMHDIRWLGYDWEDRLYYASDYFDQLYEWATHLIKEGKAYVDDLSQEEMREYRGTLTEPGKNSPYRDRSVAENLDLFERMKNGEFEEGSRVLRAKIDMSSPIINMRDPAMYRILKAPHWRTGDKWCIYPMYDWAHGQSDALEGVTHSFCSLEYVNHRPLYDWFLDQIDIAHHPQQIEFGRLNVSHTITSKRKLIRLVQEGHVNGWDDPRMPTIAGMRRRGYPAAAIRNFQDMVGMARYNRTVDMAMLEAAVRDELNAHAPRAMAVLRPLRVIVTNYPEDKVEWFDIPVYPQDRENITTRQVPFSRELFIEQDDYMENAPKKFYRLSEGREVRFLGAYLLTLTEAVKDEAGNVVALHCTYDPETSGGNVPDGRKVRGTIHWVSARHALDAELRQYNVLFNRPEPEEVDEEGQDFTDNLNPDNLEILANAKVEPSLAFAEIGQSFQFMRQGYYAKDPDSTEDHPVFNLTVALRDSWAKVK
jgi:glutaminyl-tRNA synthetase